MKKAGLAELQGQEMRKKDHQVNRQNRDGHSQPFLYRQPDYTWQVLHPGSL